MFGISDRTGLLSRSLGRHMRHSWVRRYMLILVYLYTDSMGRRDAPDGDGVFNGGLLSDDRLDQTLGFCGEADKRSVCRDTG